MAASQRLSHLLQLADQGPALRAALAEEVAELLTAWPSDYPQSMRMVCETLLTKAALDVDSATRAKLRELLASYPDLSSRLLPREAGLLGLIVTARLGENLVPGLAQTLGVDHATTHQILDDESGVALAAACKAAHMDRSAFSALALLMYPARDRSQAFAMLDAFEQAANFRHEPHDALAS